MTTIFVVDIFLHLTSVFFGGEGVNYWHFIYIHVVLELVSLLHTPRTALHTSKIQAAVYNCSAPFCP